MKRVARLMLVVLAVWPALAQAQPTAIANGPSSFAVPGATPDGSAVRVWSYRPPGLMPDDPIVIVMHGVLRNGRTYRDNWVEAGRVHRLLVLVPEMTQKQFPGNAGYSLGNMTNRTGKALPAEMWAWQTIEKVFDRARIATGSRRERYALFGHSAGAQFVHRLVMFAERPRVEVAISANAGWYAMPTLTERYPYGLRDGPVDAGRVRAGFARPLVVLLGSEDTDPDDDNLRRTTAAMRQGVNRLERGQRFFELAKAEAKAAGSTFAWRLDLVPGADHDNQRMIGSALEWISGRKR